MTVAASPLPPPAAPWRRRRYGVLLILFGATGLLLFGTGLVLLTAPIDPDEGLFGIEAQRRQLVALLDASDTAMDDAETAVRDADVSLRSTAEAAGSASAFMTELATTMRAASGSLRINVFGSQPFAPVADDFERVAGRAGDVATDLEAASASVETASADLASLAEDLADMRVELARIRDDLPGPIDTGQWRLLIGAVLAWLAVPALVSLVIGLRWLRPPGAR